MRVIGSAKYRHCCAENVAESAIAFGVGRVNDLHPRARPQASRRQTFNSDAIQRLYERAGMRSLVEGQKVSYDIVTERGKQAAANLQAA